MRLGRLTTYGLVACILSVGTAQAQIVKGTFVGTIGDSSGAIVPGAKVAVKNLATNVVVTTSTDAVGSYIVPFLDPGIYSVSAELTGFKTAVEPQIKLDVAAKVRVDFTLEVGSTGQKVEVRAAAPLVETDTSTVGLVVTSEQLKQLPLLTRNYQELSQLAPTAVAPTLNHTQIFKPSLTTGNYFQVGGQRGAYISYTTDGVDTEDVWFQSQSLIPSLDSIEEFKVQDHNFAAEYGRGAVQFTSTTRQGTSTPHGSFYEYLKNEALNANGFFDNKARRKKVPIRDSQFGLTVGGPIYIPKLYNGKDKSFFFFGYEGRRRHQNTTAFANWPEPAWLTGDFSDLKNLDGTLRLIYDPATTRPDGKGGFLRDPFPGNKILSNRFDPVALAEIPFIPQPNARGIRVGSNAVGNVLDSTGVDFWTLRLDQNFSARNRVYGRFMRSQENKILTSFAPLSGALIGNWGNNLMVGDTYTFSNHVVNELRFGYNRGWYLPRQEGSDGICLTPCKLINYTLDVFGIKNLTKNPKQFGLPNFGIAGFSGVGGRADAPLGGLTNTYHVSDNLIMTHGKHSVKTGFDIRRTGFDMVAGFGSRGSFGFSGQFTQLPGKTNTGSSVADFLLGLSNNAAGLFGDTEARLHGTMYGFYLQDDWRITRKLALNLGVRYENYRPWTEEDGKISRFDYGSIPGSCFGAACPPGRFFVPKPGEPWYDPANRDWGPRIGLTYSPFGDSKTVIRAAYGLFYSPTDMNEQGHGVFNPPNSLNFTIVPQNPITDLTSTKLSNLFPGGILPDRAAPLVTNNWTLPAVSPLPYIKNNKDGTINQWQLTVQREVLTNLLVEVGYMGSNAYNGQIRIDYNQARPDKPGELTPISSRRPYPSLSTFFANEHSAKGNYQAGFLRVERRFAQGFSLLTAYTFAKTLDTSGNLGPAPQDPYNKNAEKALSVFHAKHRFTAGYIWELPFGRGRRFGSNVHPALDEFIGGWQLSGITTFQSGSPTFDIFVLNDSSNTGAITGNVRPDQIAPITYLDIRKTGKWFDPSSLVVPKFGTFGNMSKGAVLNPGINNWNLMIAKSFRIKERGKVQFRAEMYNAFNHAQFGGPFPIVGPPFENLTGNVTSTGPVFGGGNSARNIQLALRLEF